MGSDKEVKIGKKIISENSEITLSVKTAIWAIGIVIALFSSIFTYTYLDVKADVKNYKIQLDKNNQELVKQINNNLDSKLDKQRDRDDKFIEDIAKIRGDVQLILDRTQRIGVDNTLNGVSTINNNQPVSPAPFRNH